MSDLVPFLFSVFFIIVLEKDSVFMFGCPHMNQMQFPTRSKYITYRFVSKICYQFHLHFFQHDLLFLILRPSTVSVESIALPKWCRFFIFRLFIIFVNPVGRHGGANCKFNGGVTCFKTLYLIFSRSNEDFFSRTHKTRSDISSINNTFAHVICFWGDKQ